MAGRDKEARQADDVQALPRTRSHRNQGVWESDGLGNHRKFHSQTWQAGRRWRWLRSLALPGEAFTRRCLAAYAEVQAARFVDDSRVGPGEDRARAIRGARRQMRAACVAGANGAIYWIAPLGKTRLPFSARSITERTAALAKRNESQKLGNEISSTVSREADFRLGVASIKKTS